MSWSLNEVESLARKAARGSGLSWGLSDEAGKATRWLVKNGLPGLELLAELLTQNDGQDYFALCPVETGTKWAAQDGPLCPLITGTAINDHAALLANGQGIELGQTSYPLLLAPYVAAVARMTNRTLTISWRKACLTLSPDAQVALTGSQDTQVAVTDTVHIQVTDTEVNTALAPVNRGNLDPDTARVLTAFAQRTYAPDTPESRMAGAGAGLTDND